MRCHKMNQSPLIQVLLDNKSKILDAGKCKAFQFDHLITSLTEAEDTRYKILEKIKQLGEINLDQIQADLGLSREIVAINVDYLRELGLLAFIDEHPRFFREIIENSEHPGLFPSTQLIKDKNLCCGCGLCVSICPVDAIDYLEGTFEINEDRCINCGLCYSACPRSFFPAELNKLKYQDPDVKFTSEIKHYRDLYTAQTTEDRIIKHTPRSKRGWKRPAR